MRNYLLIVLLLAGCSSEPLMEELQGGSDAEQIYRAESQCMKNKDYKNVSEYNACVDTALGNNQSAKNIVAERAARAKNGSSANGLSEADRLCERYGHVIGTTEYEVCIDYANENSGNIGNTSRR